MLFFAKATLCSVISCFLRALFVLVWLSIVNTSTSEWLERLFICVDVSVKFYLLISCIYLVNIVSLWLLQFNDAWWQNENLDVTHPVDDGRVSVSQPLCHSANTPIIGSAFVYCWCDRQRPRNLTTMTLGDGPSERNPIRTKAFFDLIERNISFWWAFVLTGFSFWREFVLTGFR